MTVAGTKYKAPGSPTKVIIGGKKAKRSAIKAGLGCLAEGKGKSKMSSWNEVYILLNHIAGRASSCPPRFLADAANEPGYLMTRAALAISGAGVR
ncbi:MAG: hypothetical protein OEO83_08645 [Alphaproteobacteria bacterium]|nr:hypothetical protein [Alphaproteobacteria bacterium]